MSENDIWLKTHYREMAIGGFQMRIAQHYTVTLLHTKFIMLRLTPSHNLKVTAGPQLHVAF